MAFASRLVIFLHLVSSLYSAEGEDSKGFPLVRQGGQFPSGGVPPDCPPGWTPGQNPPSSGGTGTPQPPVAGGGGGGGGGCGGGCVLVPSPGQWPPGYVPGPGGVQFPGQQGPSVPYPVGPGGQPIPFPPGYFPRLFPGRSGAVKVTECSSASSCNSHEGCASISCTDENGTVAPMTPICVDCSQKSNLENEGIHFEGACDSGSVTGLSVDVVVGLASIVIFRLVVFLDFTSLNKQFAH